MPEFVDPRNQQHAAQDGHAQEGDNTHGCGNAEMRAGQDQGENPADQRKWDRRENEQGVFEGIEGHVQQEKYQQQAHRHDHRQASLLVPQLIELAG